MIEERETDNDKSENVIKVTCKKKLANAMFQNV